MSKVNSEIETIQSQIDGLKLKQIDMLKKAKSDDMVWGGFPLYDNDGVLMPIMSDFIELDKPVTVNFNQYLERI